MNKPLRKACLIALLTFQTLSGLTTVRMVRVPGHDQELPDLNIALEPEPPIPDSQPARRISSSSTQESWMALPPAREVAIRSSHPNLAAPQSSAASQTPRGILYPFTQPSWARRTNVEKVAQECTWCHGPSALKRTRVSKPLTSSDSSETSTDGGALQDNGPPRKLQKLIPSLEIHSSIDEHDRTGEASAVIRPSLNVHNWDMVKAHEKEQQGDKNGQPVLQPSEKLARFFKMLRFKESDGFYWLPPEQLQHTQALYSVCKNKWPEGNVRGWSDIRSKLAAEILLKLADQKLHLDAHPIFKKLMRWARSTIYTNRGALTTSRLSPRRMESIIIYVSKVTKIATFLIILRRSTLNQHTSGQLSKAMVDGILNLIRGFWEKLERMDEKLLDAGPWANSTSKILQAQVPPGSYHSFFIYKKERFFEVANRVAEYWEEENIQNDTYQHIKNHQKILNRITSDILFHSNPKIVGRYIN
ncbi:hypothetical protein VP01_2003g3 [Puccinia sorghi]|uniref:Uncharacterized protein n=1 Tax=Puccinia sorghi TaxID=27349 RepID=A0A0L6VBD1_9BASI|nr:hypothetical protein VP01_2003g3 [Puccinia sorghi]